MTCNDEKKETFWSRHVEGYEGKQAFVCTPDIIDRVLTELRKETGLGHVLELGCGTGLFTEALIDSSSRITATDFSDEMVDEACNKRGDLDIVDFVKADGTCLQFDDDSFDTVFMANFIHLVDDPVSVVKESYRVLKPGGKIIITSFAVDEMHLEARKAIVERFVGTFGVPPRVKDRPRTTTVQDIVDLLVSSGFEMVRGDILGLEVKSSYIVGKK